MASCWEEGEGASLGERLVGSDLLSWLVPSCLVPSSLVPSVGLPGGGLVE